MAVDERYVGLCGAAIHPAGAQDVLQGALAQAAQAVQKSASVVTEPDAHESIEDGVEAAVAEGNHLAQNNGRVQLNCTPVVGGSQLVEGVQEDHHVVWSPAEQEDAGDQNGYSNHFLPLQPLGAAQDPDDGYVAEAHDQRGQEEAHDVI